MSTEMVNFKANEDTATTLGEKEMQYGYKEDEESKPNDDLQGEEENSPIPEVAAIVPITDDPSLPVNTFRVWFMGLAFSCMIAFVNQFTWFRDEPLTVSPLVVQLLTLPFGRFMERVIPRHPFFNPSRFNMKEHVLIVTMVNSCYQTAYAIDIITVQKFYYGQDIGWLGGFLLVLSTQCLGYGMAGVLRPYLVYPASMVWPSNLANIAMFTSFHLPHENKGMTRIKWFLIVCGLSFAWYWLPGYLMSVLSLFSWVCWIAPDNIILSQLTGARGLSLFALTFDWSTVSSALFNPLVSSAWVHWNILIGFALFAWVLVPAFYYTNTWNSTLLPLMSARLFQTNGAPYNISVILSEDKTLIESAYEEYGPLRIPASFGLSYAFSFATLSAVLVHGLLWDRKQIAKQWKQSRSENDDIHTKLMRRYPEVPAWWYYVVFLASLATGFVVIYVWPIGLPWWGLLLAVALCCIFLLPIGIITAISNQTPGLNVITEFVIGLALPGHPIANVTFKTYGYISMFQAITFVSDLKLGHYLKVPPRSMFNVQLAGTAVAAFVNLATARWLFSVVKGICTEDAYPWTCRSANTFFSASVIWGVIGPARMFGGSSPYSVLLWSFALGAALPIPFYFIAKRYPNTPWKSVHLPLILSAPSMIPPSFAINYTSWLAVGLFSMHYLRKYHNALWSKFNYVTAAALDSGLALSTLCIFAFAQFIPPPTWWGNGVTTPDNCPNSGTPLASY